MGQHINKRPTPLDCRIKTASKDLHIILKDLQRDCKPYWKFSELERELLDIADAVKRLGADHRREIAARRNLKQEILKIKEKVDKKIKEAVKEATVCPATGNESCDCPVCQS